MSTPNTAEINFTDATQLVVPLADNQNNVLVYSGQDTLIVNDSFQGPYVMYPWHTIKNVKFTP